MADAYNYRRGETNPVACKIITAQSCELGDALGLSTGCAIPAANEAYSNLSQAQFDFAAKFVGIASQRKAGGSSTVGHGGGQANRIRVSTEGVFEFDTASTTYEVGALVGMEKASGSALESKKVAPVATAAQAIGSVEEAVTTATTKVKVRIFGTKMLAAINK